MYRLMLLCMVFVMGVCSAEEAEISNSYSVLPSTGVYEGDYFALNSGVEISGLVTQDAYVIGSQVIVDGVIEGDLLVIAGVVEITGTVKGNVRALAGQLLISGHVGKSVSGCCGNLHMTGSANIGQSLVAIAGNIDLTGTVNKDVTIASTSARLSNQVRGSVFALVGQLRITSKAIFEGTLRYTSANPIALEKEALIKGGVFQNKSSLDSIKENNFIDLVLYGSKIAGFIMNLVYTFILGLVLMKIAPHSIGSITAYLHKKPMRALFNGLLFAIIVPLVSLLLLMTILGVPFALTLIAANIIGFYTAKIYVIFWGSEKLLHFLHVRGHKILAYSLGVIVYFALLLIPYFGITFSILSMLMGLGAMITFQLNRHHDH